MNAKLKKTLSGVLALTLAASSVLSEGVIASATYDGSGIYADYDFEAEALNPLAAKTADTPLTLAGAVKKEDESNIVSVKIVGTFLIREDESEIVISDGAKAQVTYADETPNQDVAITAAAIKYAGVADLAADECTSFPATLVLKGTDNELYEKEFTVTVDKVNGVVLDADETSAAIGSKTYYNGDYKNTIAPADFGEMKATITYDSGFEKKKVTEPEVVDTRVAIVTGDAFTKGFTVSYGNNNSFTGVTPVDNKAPVTLSYYGVSADAFNVTLGVEQLTSAVLDTVPFTVSPSSNKYTFHVGDEIGYNTSATIALGWASGKPNDTDTVMIDDPESTTTPKAKIVNPKFRAVTGTPLVSLSAFTTDEAADAQNVYFQYDSYIITVDETANNYLTANAEVLAVKPVSIAWATEADGEAVSVVKSDTSMPPIATRKIKVTYNNGDTEDLTLNNSKITVARYATSDDPTTERLYLYEDTPIASVTGDSLSYLVVYTPTEDWDTAATTKTLPLTANFSALKATGATISDQPEFTGAIAGELLNPAGTKINVTYNDKTTKKTITLGDIKTGEEWKADETYGASATAKNLVDTGYYCVGTVGETFEWVSVGGAKTTLSKTAAEIILTYSVVGEFDGYTISNITALDAQDQPKKVQLAGVKVTGAELTSEETAMGTLVAGENFLDALAGRTLTLTYNIDDKYLEGQSSTYPTTVAATAENVIITEGAAYTAPASGATDTNKYAKKATETTELEYSTAACSTANTGVKYFAAYKDGDNTVSTAASDAFTVKYEKPTVTAFTATVGSSANKLTENVEYNPSKAADKETIFAGVTFSGTAKDKKNKDITVTIDSADVTFKKFTAGTGTGYDSTNKKQTVEFTYGTLSTTGEYSVVENGIQSIELLDASTSSKIKTSFFTDDKDSAFDPKTVKVKQTPRSGSATTVTLWDETKNDGKGGLRDGYSVAFKVGTETKTSNFFADPTSESTKAYLVVTYGTGEGAVSAQKEVTITKAEATAVAVTLDSTVAAQYGIFDAFSWSTTDDTTDTYKKGILKDATITVTKNSGKTIVYSGKATVPEGEVSLADNISKFTLCSDSEGATAFTGTVFDKAGAFTGYVKFADTDLGTKVSPAVTINVGDTVNALTAVKFGTATVTSDSPVKFAKAGTVDYSQIKVSGTSKNGNTFTDQAIATKEGTTVTFVEGASVTGISVTKAFAAADAKAATVTAFNKTASLYYYVEEAGHDHYEVVVPAKKFYDQGAVLTVNGGKIVDVLENGKKKSTAMTTANIASITVGTTDVTATMKGNGFVFPETASGDLEITFCNANGDIINVPGTTTPYRLEGNVEAVTLNDEPDVEIKPTIFTTLPTTFDSAFAGSTVAWAATNGQTLVYKFNGTAWAIDSSSTLDPDIFATLSAKTITGEIKTVDGDKVVVVKDGDTKIAEVSISQKDPTKIALSSKTTKNPVKLFVRDALKDATTDDAIKALLVGDALIDVTYDAKTKELEVPVKASMIDSDSYEAFKDAAKTTDGWKAGSYKLTLKVGTTATVVLPVTLYDYKSVTVKSKPAASALTVVEGMATTTYTGVPDGTTVVIEFTDSKVPKVTCTKGATDEAGTNWTTYIDESVESLDKTGATSTKFVKGGKANVVFTVKDTTISNKIALTIGDKKVKTFTLNIQTKVFNKNDPFTLTNGDTATVEFNDNTSEIFTYDGTEKDWKNNSSSEFTKEITVDSKSYRPGTLGEYTITVNYKNATKSNLTAKDSFKVTVRVNPTAVPALVTVPNGAAYEGFTETKYESIDAAVKAIDAYNKSKGNTAATNGNDWTVTVIGDNNPQTITVPTSVKSFTLSGTKLKTTTASISPKCKFYLDTPVQVVDSKGASTNKAFAIKGGADVIIENGFTADGSALSVSGTKTATLTVNAPATFTGISNFDTVAAPSTATIAAGGKVSGVANVTGDFIFASTADVKVEYVDDSSFTYNTTVDSKGKTVYPKVQVGTVSGKLDLYILDASGNMMTIGNGTPIFNLANAKTNIDDLLQKNVIINNDDGTNELSAVQYGKEVRAEFLELLVLDIDGESNYYSSFEKASEAMLAKEKEAKKTKTAGTINYAIHLQGPAIADSKFKLPTEAAGLLITDDDGGYPMVFQGLTSLTTKYPTDIYLGGIYASTKDGKPADLKFQFNAKDAKNSIGITTVGGKVYAKSFSISGDATSMLGIWNDIKTDNGSGNEIGATITGFGCVQINDHEVEIAKLNTNWLDLAGSTLSLINGAEVKLTAGKAKLNTTKLGIDEDTEWAGGIYVDNGGATINFCADTKGNIKPISTVNGIFTENIGTDTVKFVNKTGASLDGKQILEVTDKEDKKKAVEDIFELDDFDIDGLKVAAEAGKTFILENDKGNTGKIFFRSVLFTVDADFDGDGVADEDDYTDKMFTSWAGFLTEVANNAKALGKTEAKKTKYTVKFADGIEELDLAANFKLPAKDTYASIDFEGITTGTTILTTVNKLDLTANVSFENVKVKTYKKSGTTYTYPATAFVFNNVGKLNNVATADPTKPYELTVDESFNTLVGGTMSFYVNNNKKEANKIHVEMN